MRNFFIWLSLIKISAKERRKAKGNIEKIRELYNKSDYGITLNFINVFVEKLEKKGIGILTPADQLFISTFKEEDESPYILYYVGDLSLLKQKGIAIVGSRNVSEYGVKATRELSDLIAKEGITIVSGGAIGVDRIAHEAALKYGGNTICVLGCGFFHLYPKANISLYKEIIKKGGLIISEYAPMEVARKYYFLERNRIIALLSRLLIVTEASKNSGSLTTATYAMEYGRDVIAIPHEIGSKNAEGANSLIQMGAQILTDYRDILTY